MLNSRTCNSIPGRKDAPPYQSVQRQDSNGKGQVRKTHHELNFPVSPFSLIIRTIRTTMAGEELRTHCGSELAMTPTGFGMVDHYD